jgi:hypothetical protein
VRKHDVTKEIVPRPFGSLTKPTLCEFVPLPCGLDGAAASDKWKRVGASRANTGSRGLGRNVTIGRYIENGIASAEPR